MAADVAAAVDVAATAVPVAVAVRSAGNLIFARKNFSDSAANRLTLATNRSYLRTRRRLCSTVMMKESFRPRKICEESSLHRCIFSISYQRLFEACSLESTFPDNPLQRVHSSTISLLIYVPCVVAAEAIQQRVESSCVRAIASHCTSRAQ
jgi:hypothetical protein